MSKYIIIYIILTIIYTIYAGITIIEPQELSELTGGVSLDVEFANFGIRFNEVYSRGEVFVDSKTEKMNGCDDLNGFIWGNNHTSNEHLHVLMVNRGQCSFVYKARQAQNIGANMLLIINNDDNIHNVIMADDGTGSDIYIPVLMITKTQGNIIQQYIQKNINSNIRVIIDIRFVSVVSDNVLLRFFFGSNDLKAYQLISNITNYILPTFQNQITFEPVYVIHRSPKYIEEGDHGGSKKGVKDCLGNGRYCYFIKEDSIVNNGEYVVYENIRQKCIFNLFSKNKDKNMWYFYYLDKFYHMCLNRGEGKTPRLNPTCSNYALEEVGINIEYIEKCIMESFGVKNSDFDSAQYDIYKNNINSILEYDYKLMQNFELTEFPSVVIDKVPLKKAIKESNIVEELCKRVKKRPELCEHFVGLKEPKTSNRKGTIIFLTIILIILNIILFIVCWKYIGKRVYERIGSVDGGGIDIDGRINSVIGNYFSLKESKSNISNNSNSNNSIYSSNNNSNNSGSHSLPEIVIDKE